MEGKFNTIVQLSNLTTVRADSCHQLSYKILGGDAEFGAIVGGDAENGAKKLLSVTEEMHLIAPPSQNRKSR